MNERIEAVDVVLIPVASGAFDALVSGWLEFVGGEPSVIRELVIKGVAEIGMQGMSWKLVENTNKRFALSMGWPVGEEDEA